MTNTFRSAAVSLALVIVSSCAVQRTPPPANKSDVVQQVMPSMVQLVYERDDAPIRVASGVVVGSGAEPRRSATAASYIVTSGHVVLGTPAEAARLTVRYHGPDQALHRAPAAVEAIDEGTDLAVVRLDGIRLPAARFDREEHLRLGDDVVVVGSPFGRGLSVSSGIVSQLGAVSAAEGEQSEPLLKVDAPVGYGSSGGGVFQVRRGRLIGIVEGYRTATVSLQLAGNAYSFDVPMPGETFVVPASEIRRFLRDKGLARLLAD